MNTHADKTQENKSQSVSNGEFQMQSGGESTFQFVDNRPQTVAQRKLQEMANNCPQVSQLSAFQDMANNSLQAKRATQFQAMANHNASEVAQMKFHFEPTVAKDIDDTALKRVWNHDLTKEIEEKDDWHAEVKYVSSNYSANSGYVTNGGNSLVSGAKLELPKKEDEEAENLEVLKKKNEVSTLHELVHARAIFNDEFVISPMIFHTVYKNDLFEGREKIPLEEAVTVGFKNSDEYKHVLHTTDTFKELSSLTEEEWVAFAPKLKDRYKRIYVDSETEGLSVFTDNKAREEIGVDSREFYANEAIGVDEAWAPHKSEVLDDNDSKHTTLKAKYDEVKELPWENILSQFQGQPEEDVLDLFSSAPVDTPSQEEWKTSKVEISALLTVVHDLRALVTDKGGLTHWANYKKEFMKLAAHKFNDYSFLTA